MKENFDHIIKGNIPVLVDFSAEWCQPCKMMSPVLKQLKEKVGETVRIIKIDVDRNRELAARYSIHSVPSLILFQNGNVRWSGSGVMSASHLAAIISRSIAAVHIQ
jgi:thioredoxin 1